MTVQGAGKIVVDYNQPGAFPGRGCIRGGGRNCYERITPIIKIIWPVKVLLPRVGLVPTGMGETKGKGIDVRMSFFFVLFRGREREKMFIMESESGSLSLSGCYVVCESFLGVFDECNPD